MLNWTLLYCIDDLPHLLKSIFSSKEYRSPKCELCNPSGIKHFRKQNPLCVVPHLPQWFLLIIRVVVSLFSRSSVFSVLGIPQRRSPTEGPLLSCSGTFTLMPLFPSSFPPSARPLPKPFLLLPLPLFFFLQLFLFSWKISSLSFVWIHCGMHDYSRYLVHHLKVQPHCLYLRPDTWTSEHRGHSL